MKTSLSWGDFFELNIRNCHDFTVRIDTAVSCSRRIYCLADRDSGSVKYNRDAASCLFAKGRHCKAPSCGASFKFSCPQSWLLFRSGGSWADELPWSYFCGMVADSGCFSGKHRGDYSRHRMGTQNCEEVVVATSPQRCRIKRSGGTTNAVRRYVLSYIKY